MNFEDIKDQLKEKSFEYWEKIQESDTYIQLKDRFEGLSPIMQKSVMGIVIFLVLYFFYSIPGDYVTASDESLGYFTDNRHTIRDLFRVNREAKSVTKYPQPMASDALASEIKAYLNIEKIAPEFYKGTSTIQAPGKPPVAPGGVDQEGVKVVVNKLNLKQLRGLGESLSAISPVTKLLDMSVVADEKNNHYFDVEYTLSSFKWKEPEALPVVEEKKFKNKKRD